MVEALGSSPREPKRKEKKPRVQGGKYGFDDYSGAVTHTHEVEGCTAGSLCQACGRGKYYPGEDRKKLTFKGSPVIQVEKHIQKTLRCNQCGHETMTPLQHRKWTPEARSSLIIQKLYGSPWNRMSRIQKLYGVPVAASTCWEQSKMVWVDSAQFIAARLQEYVANSPSWMSDDTGNKILSVLADNKGLDAKETRACHTTAVCASYGDFKIHWYVTTNQYCAENLNDLFSKRTDPQKILLTTDASNQSIPKGELLKQVDSTLCLGGHGRKKFKDLESNYPEICHYFLILIGFLYKHDRSCKDKSPGERLAYHQEHSTGIIEAIYAKIAELFDQRRVEPNSDLGKAMRYWLKHRGGLTAFLRIKGVTLDTNWVERTLRVIALYRKNSLFFKTKHSALIINELFSLVSTCEANGINAFAYLNWIQVHWKDVQENPDLYLPWCFEQDTEDIAA